MKRFNERQLTTMVFIFYAALVFCLTGSALLSDDSVVGAPTRDLFDHVALIDSWKITIVDWAFPTGGVLVPPDIFSMIFAI